LRMGRYLLHNFVRNKLRWTLAVLSVTFTFTMMLSIGIFFGSAQKADFSAIERDVAFDILIEGSGGNDLDPAYIEAGAVSTQISGRGGVDVVSPVLKSYAVSVKDDLSPDHFFTVYGVDPELSIGVVDHENGRYDLSDGSCVISTKAAETLISTEGKNAYVGDDIRIYVTSGGVPIPLELKVSGIYDISGRFEQSSGYTVNPYIVVSLTSLQGTLSLQGKATSVIVKVDRGMYNLEDPTNPSKKVESLARDIAGDIGPGYDVSAPKAMALEGGTGSFLTSLSYLFAILFPAISGILVSSVMNLSVEERTQELATLRLLGARRGFVLGVMLWELAAIVGIGMLPALIIAPLITGGLATLVGLSIPITELDFSLRIVLQITIALIVTLLFSLSPLLKALRTNPAQSIGRIKAQGSYRFVSTERVDRRLVLSGWIVFLAIMISIASVIYLINSSGTDGICLSSIGVITILPISLSIGLLGGVPYVEELLVTAVLPVTRKTNKVIRGYIRRNVRRNISTNLIFGTIVAILVMFSSVFSSVLNSSADTVRMSLGSDVRVFMYQSGVDAGIISQVSDIDGVEAIGASSGPWIMSATDLIGKSSVDIMAYGITPTLCSALYDKAEISSGSLEDISGMKDDECSVSLGMSRAMDLGRGDRISVKVASDDGSDAKEFFRIAAVIESFPGFLGIFHSDQDQMQGAFFSMDGIASIRGISPDNMTVNDIYVKTTSASDAENVVSLLSERFGSVDGVYIIDTEQTVLMSTLQIVAMNLVMTVISTILLVVAIFSLVINLYASVKEREFELGVIRSLGLRKIEIFKAMMIEGVIIAIVSMILGIVAGIVVAYLGVLSFNQISIVKFDFYPPYLIIVYLTAITLVFGILGSVIPSFMVARKEILNLMRRIE
jgi:putative ABC transport system permease protein